MEEKKKVKCGVGYVVDKNFNIKYMTRKQAQNYVNKKAKELRPLGFWNGIVAEINCEITGDSWFRISIAGQPYKPYK